MDVQVAIAAVLLVGVSSGCHRQPCDSQPAACINLTVDSNVSTIDQLAVYVDMPQKEYETSPAIPASWLQFPYQLALDFPASTTQVHVSVQGIELGSLAAYGAVDVSVLPTGYASATVTLDQPLSGDGGTIDGASGDFADQGAPDLNIDLSIADLTPDVCASWCAVPPMSTFYVRGIWGASATDVWAVGYVGSTTGVIDHFDGSSWSNSFTLANVGFWQVFGVGTNLVWAVGDNGTIATWNGASWSTTQVGTTNSYHAVWASGPSDAWTVGYPGSIAHWNGANWSPVMSQTTLTYQSLFGTSANDIWAAGDGGVIIHWNGSMWSTPATLPYNSTRGLWATSPTNYWAVGDGGNIYNFNGTSWTQSTVTSFQVLGVSGTSANDVWAVGVGGQIRHWTGTTWSSSTSQTVADLAAVWGGPPTWIGGNSFLAHN